MRKYLINIVFFAGVALAIYAIRMFLVQDYTDKQLKRVEHMQENIRQQAQQRLEEQKTAQEQKRLDAPVKVLVRAKDVRTCMKDLETDTLNNAVVECTKDHYKETR
ncbi:hypothetical protein [Methylophilus sp.]|uniref:hypothetical protein n=1 Tax=Methylophilus sp. TaxID=29541 RepID=UPI004035005E